MVSNSVIWICICVCVCVCVCVVIEKYPIKSWLKVKGLLSSPPLFFALPLLPSFIISATLCSFCSLLIPSFSHLSYAPLSPPFLSSCRSPFLLRPKNHLLPLILSSSRLSPIDILLFTFFPLISLSSLAFFETEH